MSEPKCSNCGKPATCVGRYESMDNPIAFACDDCCGNGNEDGWCKDIGTRELRTKLAEAEAENAELKTNIKVLHNLGGDMLSQRDHLTHQLAQSEARGERAAVQLKKVVALATDSDDGPPATSIHVVSTIVEMVSEAISSLTSADNEPPKRVTGSGDAKSPTS